MKQEDKDGRESESRTAAETDPDQWHRLSHLFLILQYLQPHIQVSTGFQPFLTSTLPAFFSCSLILKGFSVSCSSIEKDFYITYTSQHLTLSLCLYKDLNVTKGWAMINNQLNAGHVITVHTVLTAEILRAIIKWRAFNEMCLYELIKPEMVKL